MDRLKRTLLSSTELVALQRGPSSRQLSRRISQQIPHGRHTLTISSGTQII